MHFVGCLNVKDPCSMKYPPVVSTLEEWLDGKFGIQGIDAVSCAFYVLSLLQRDETNEPEAFYQFPCSKIVDDQSLSYWPQNSWSNWGFDCYENSSAAKCVSAPVQRYEIEHLGNDLSPSLKSIKSEGGDRLTQGCLCDKQCFSLPASDPVKRCQQAFSVQDQHPNGKDKCNVTSVAECKNTVWANESACVGFFKHKLEGGGLEGKNKSSSMADKAVHEKGEDFWMADPIETGKLFLHDENLLREKKDGNFFSWNTSDDKSSSSLEKNFKKDECPDRIKEVWEPGIFGKLAKSTASVSMPHVGAGTKYGIEGLSDSAEEDSKLAQLIAKFDHSIEAIWNLDSTSPLSYSTTDEQQNLPWSFNKSISPPQDVLKIDRNSFENNLDSSSEENSFIHSGTNIINSIWSDQPFLSKSTSRAESGAKYVSGGVNDFNNTVSDRSDLCCKWKVFLTADDLLHNEFNLYGWNSGTSDTQIEAPKNTNENYLQEVPKECSDVLWNKIQSFPTLFSNVNFQEQFCRMENFQDADCENQQKGNSCMMSSCSPRSISCFQGSCQDSVQDTAEKGKRNFSTLNHNREDSSFTEVLPRLAGTKKYQETRIGNSCMNQTKHASSITTQSSDENKSNFDNTGKEEEEDLLTSARTHFRPIQQENPEPHNNPACSYTDGTTFVISSNFAEVPFKRSESGTLYLESDDVPGAPKKYMEYKDKRSGDQVKCAHNTSKDNLGNKGAFIPKFCVRQIEKCCQTDESDESSDELNSKRVKRDCAEKERKSNLFFSEDEIVKSVANYLDEDGCKFSSNEIECKDNFDDERMDDISTRNAKNDSRSLEAEMYIWNKAGCKCNNNYMFSSKSDSLRAFGASFLGEKEGLWEPASAARVCQSRYSIWSCSPGPQTEPCPACEKLSQDKTMQYSQLREELSEDGEQLLSDLSSLQPLQLSTGWLDDALDQGGWGTEPNLLTRVSSRRRLVSWGQFGEG